MGDAENKDDTMTAEQADVAARQPAVPATAPEAPAAVVEMDVETEIKELRAAIEFVAHRLGVGNELAKLFSSFERPAPAPAPSTGQTVVL